MKLQVGIVIPCKDDQVFLADCVNSLLGQTVNPHSVVIVDDGSEIPIQRSDLPAGPFPFPIFLVRNEKNLGLGAARNLGITLCGAEWFIPLDCDDRLDKKAIECCSHLLQREPEIDVIQFSAVYHEDGESYQDLTKPLPMNLSVLQQRNPCHPTALIRFEVWSRLGGYIDLGNSTHRGYEDWDFWIRTKAYPKPFFIYQSLEALLHYTVRPGSKLSTQDKDAAELELWVKNRVQWRNPSHSAECLRKLRDVWGVQRLQ